jgi:hypothetical protein
MDNALAEITAERDRPAGDLADVRAQLAAVTAWTDAASADRLHTELAGQRDTHQRLGRSG